MSDPLVKFGAIAARARQEHTPAVDVRAGVLRALRQAEAEEPDDRPAICFAFGSCLAAASVALAYGPALFAAIDPLAGLLRMSPGILQ